MYLKLLGPRLWNESKVGMEFKWASAKEDVCLHACMQDSPRKDSPKNRLHQPADCLLASATPRIGIMDWDKLRRMRENFV